MARNEERACRPVAINDDGFNSRAKIPCGVRIQHIRKAMDEYLEFLGFINSQLFTK